MMISTLTTCERNHYAPCVMRRGNKESEIGICNQTGLTLEWDVQKYVLTHVLNSVLESNRCKCEMTMLNIFFFNRRVPGAATFIFSQMETESFL